MLCVTPFFVLLCWLRDLSMLEPTSAIGTAVPSTHSIYIAHVACSALARQQMAAPRPAASLATPAVTYAAR